MNRAKNVCGQKSKVVIELFKMTRIENPWRNNRGSDAACESSLCVAKATCDCKKEHPQVETHNCEGRRHDQEIPPTRSG